MESYEILEILRNDFKAAREEAAAADKIFMAIIGEVPSGLPHSDGSQRIHNVARELNFARHKMAEAEARLHAFLIVGTVPDDLKEGRGARRRIGPG